MKEYIFVYGVFRDSGRILLDNAVFCGKSFVLGKLFKVNEFYPGFVESKDNKVIGDVYLIDNSILSELDDFEGDEYIRRKIKTSSDIECWIYEYKNDTTHLKEIKGGDWMLR